MTEVVDELVVTLGLDASKFSDGQRKAVDAMRKTQEDFTKRAKTMEESSKGVTNTLFSIRNEFLALGAAILGSQGLKQLVDQTTRANVALSNFSATLNTAPQYVWGLNAAIQELGGSADDGANLLGALNKQIKEAQLMGGQIPKSLLTLAGMTNSKLDINQGPVAYLKSLSAAAKALSDQGGKQKAQASSLLEMGGFDPAQIAAMEKYGAAIDKIANDRSRLGPSTQDIEASKEFVSEWTKFGEEMGKLFNDTLPAILAPIDTILKSINGALDRANAYVNGAAPSEAKQALMHPNGSGGQAISDWITNWTTNDHLAHLHENDRGVEIGGKSIPLLRADEFSGNGSPGSGGGIEVDGRPVSRGNPMPITLTGRDGDGPQSLWEMIFGKSDNGGAPGSGAARSLGDAAKSLFGGGGSAPSGNGLPNGENPTPGTATAGSVVSRLMRDYGFTRDQAVGAAGVMGYESGDFGTMQERGQAPGHGGWGWAQWTGPRRRAFMTWAGAHNLDPASDAANYGFLQHELATNYAHVVPIMRRQQGVDASARAWEHHFEGMTEGGPGIPAFAEHVARARRYDRLLPQNIGAAPGHSGPHPRNLPTALSLSTMGNRHNVTSSSTSNALHIGRIDVNAPRATNAHEIASGISSALQSNMFAMLAQSGQV